MSSQRLYQIVKTFLNFGLDKMVPAGLLPWYVKLGRASLFWLRNKHKDKTPEQRFRLAGAAEELEARGWRLRLLTRHRALVGSSRELSRELARVEVGGPQSTDDWWMESCSADEPIYIFRGREDGRAL